MARAARVTRLATEEMSRREPVARTPKDLGTLVLDAETGVYRPVGKRAG
jgi:hypothetical protein